MVWVPTGKAHGFGFAGASLVRGTMFVGDVIVGGGEMRLLQLTF